MGHKCNEKFKNNRLKQIYNLYLLNSSDEGYNMSIKVIKVEYILEKEKITKNLINIVLFLTALLIITKIDYIFVPIFEVFIMLIIPIIIGIFLYYCLRPITRKLTKNKKWKGVVSALTILAFILILVIIIAFAGNVLTQQFKEAFLDNEGKIIDFKDTIEEKLSSLDINIDIFDKVFSNIQKTIKAIGSNAFLLFSGIGNITTQIVLIPFILFYLLRDEEKLWYNIKRFIPIKYEKEILNMAEKIDKILSTYIVGQLMVASFIGVFMFIGYLIIKMPNAFLMGVFSMVTAIIPVIGAFLGILPAIFIGLTIDLSLVFKIIILSVIVQQIESNLVTPNIMGDKLDIHPLVIILAIIVGIHLLGIFGAFVAIPTYLIASVLFKGIYKIRNKKKLEDENQA